MVRRDGAHRTWGLWIVQSYMGFESVGRLTRHVFCSCAFYVYDCFLFLIFFVFPTALIFLRKSVLRIVVRPHATTLRLGGVRRP